jgi:Kdo2-lipid IVA lauroyltransferase/acyltransferase
MKQLLILLSKMFNLLPRASYLWLGDGLGFIWFWIVRFRRDVVLSNLRAVFAKELSEKEIRRLALRNFQHYGRTLFEIIRSISWSQAQYRKNVVVEGLENVKPFVEKNEGGFFLTAHFGNWELAIGSTSSAGIPMDVVVKHSRVPSIEELQQWYRRNMGVGIYLESGTAKDILRSLSKGRWVAFILDQFMGPPIGLPVTFFGKQAGTAVSLALLTEKKDVPVIPAYSYRDEKGRLHTKFEPPIKFDNLPDDKDQRLYEKTQKFNDVLERVVREHPEQWLWLHRRWKEYKGVPRWERKGMVPGPAFSILAMLLC